MGTVAEGERWQVPLLCCDPCLDCWSDTPERCDDLEECWYEPLELCDVVEEERWPVPFFCCDLGAFPILSWTGFLDVSVDGLTTASRTLSLGESVNMTLLAGEACAVLMAGLGVGDRGLRPLASSPDAPVDGRLREDGGVACLGDEAEDEDEDDLRFFFFFLLLKCSISRF